MSRRLAELRRDWRFVVGLMTVINFVELTAFYHFVRFAPLFLRDELNVPEADIPRVAGLVAAAAMLTGVPLSPWWGPLADRYGRKWLILRGEVAQVITYGMIALAGDIWMVYAARLVSGSAYGNAALEMAVVSLVTPPARLGTAIGVFHAMFPLAASLSPLLGTLLIKTIGLRGLFLFDTLLVTVSTVLIVCFLVEPVRRDAGLSFGKQVRDLFALTARVPAIRRSFIFYFFLAGAAWGIDPFIPIAIQRANATSPWGWDDPTAIGITLGVNGIVAALVMPALGRLTDWLGAARVMLLSSLMAMVCVFGLAAAESLPAVWALLLLAAVPQAIAATAFFAYLGSLVAPAHRSGVLGLTTVPRNVSGLIVPGLAAWASSLGFGAVFVVMGSLWLFASASALRLQRVLPPPRSSAPAETELKGES